MSGDGFGICGHKNTYNSKVKNGHWVEDMIGKDLAGMQRTNQTEYTTETREKIIDPRDMPYNAGGQHIHMLSAADIKTKNKNGLPANMLFEHLGAPGADRFMSINCMTYTSGKGTGGLRVEDLLQEKPSAEAREALKIKPLTEMMVEKSKADARSNALISSFMTESKAGSQRAEKIEFKVRAPEKEPFVPSFARKKITIW
jgi:hypothetical protein